MTSNPERLAYWYLRLNGFLLLEDFIIHPDEGSDQRTDIDLLGVRFFHRAENCIHPMQDDPRITRCNKLCNVIITEVKKGQCALNGPWTNPKDRNIHRILTAIGCIPRANIKMAAKNLYESGCYHYGNISCQLISIGNSPGNIAIPNVPQILFTNVIEFIFNRFRDYQKQKASTGNWSSDGQKLKELAFRYNEKIEFDKQVRIFFGLIDNGEIPV
ncbi:MAG: hypothetical protein ABR887_04495 [Methanoregulaceae archaeon]|jgi:hypothetical protein